jgi:hypothetical protein
MTDAFANSAKLQLFFEKYTIAKNNLIWFLSNIFETEKRGNRATKNGITISLWEQPQTLVMARIIVCWSGNSITRLLIKSRTILWSDQSDHELFFSWNSGHNVFTKLVR